MNELDNTFAEIAQIIEEARDNAYRKVNEELILMYRRVGQFLSEKSKEANYGDGYIDSLSDYIQRQFPGIKGFNRRGLYRMKQFYETYAGNEKVSPLVTQLSWTNHLLIMSGSKSDEEREFYMRLAIKERYAYRLKSASSNKMQLETTTVSFRGAKRRGNLIEAVPLNRLPHQCAHWFAMTPT